MASRWIDSNCVLHWFDEYGFPIFDGVFDTLIDPGLWGSGDGLAQCRAANERLADAVTSDPALLTVLGGQGDVAGWLTPVGGVFLSDAPPGFVWFVHQDAGRMQLVKRFEAVPVGVTAGMLIWGGYHAG